MKIFAISLLRPMLCVAALMPLVVGKISAIDMSPAIQTYLETANVTEFGYPSGTEQQRTEFANWLTSNWSAVLADIDTVAPNERLQRVIVAGAEFLSGANYISFLSGLLDNYEAQKVKKAVAIDALSPGGKKYGFLAFNYQHPTVQALCNRAKTLFANNAELQSLMNDVLSGEQGKQAGAALAMENLPEPETLPPPQ